MTQRQRQRSNGQGTIFKRGKTGTFWIAAYYDHTGQRQVFSTGTADRATALRILNKYVADNALRVHGVIDPRAEAMAEHARRPLCEHLDDFEKSLEARGVTPHQIGQVMARARRISQVCGFRTWADVSSSRTMEFLNQLRADPPAPEQPVNVGSPGPGRPRKPRPPRRGISAQTFNFYLAAMKQFARWMVLDRRAADNPLGHLKGLNVKTDRRHDRIALSAPDLRALIETTEWGVLGPDGKRAGPVIRKGMEGPERALLYRLAVETGLRAGELRSLTRSSFRLDENPPTVTVAAAYSKRRREDTLPLRSELAGLLRDHLAQVDADQPSAFAIPDAQHLAKMIRADLVDAGAAVRDASGRIADFHALRHTFITNLANGGVHPKVAQSLARHSTITLTMDRYTHRHAGDELAALAVLPDLSTTPANPMKLTGTTGPIRGKGTAHRAQRALLR